MRERLASTGLVAAGVVHEVKNALTPLAASLELQRTVLAELLTTHDLDPHVQARLRDLTQYDELARSAFERMQAVLATVRDISSAPQGAHVLLGVDGIVRSVSDLARSRFKPETDFQIDLGSRRLVLADKSALSQVVLNLLLNAADALDDQPAPRLRVRTRDLEGRQASILIEVTDNGAGMDPDVAERIFRPFFTTKAAGTGLGLSLSRRAVEDHGGQLTFRTAKGSGTTFYLRLPQAHPRTDRRIWRGE